MKSGALSGSPEGRAFREFSLDSKGEWGLKAPALSPAASFLPGLAKSADHLGKFFRIITYGQPVRGCGKSRALKSKAL